MQYVYLHRNENMFHVGTRLTEAINKHKLCTFRTTDRGKFTIANIILLELRLW